MLEITKMKMFTKLPRNVRPVFSDELGSVCSRGDVWSREELGKIQISHPPQ